MAGLADERPGGVTPYLARRCERQGAQWTKIMKKLCIVIVVLIMFASELPVYALDVDDILYMTEENPPANFTKDGEITGLSVELLKLIWAEMGFPAQKIRVLPWARGYLMLRTEPGTCLFSTSWTKTRDENEKFKWVGPIKPNNIVLFARKDRKIAFNSLDDAKKYTIGTGIGDGAENLLVEAGFDLNTFSRVSKIYQNVLKLHLGRIDLYAKNTDSVLSEIRKQGLDPKEFEIVWILSKKMHYYAFHKDTPQGLIDRFQEALDKLEEKRKELLEKYGIVE